MKILMNHLQLITLTLSFEFDYPQTVLNLMNSFSFASEAGTQVFSFDCFMDTRGNEDE